MYIKGEKLLEILGRLHQEKNFHENLPKLKEFQSNWPKFCDDHLLKDEPEGYVVLSYTWMTPVGELITFLQTEYHEAARFHHESVFWKDFVFWFDYCCLQQTSPETNTLLTFYAGAHIHVLLPQWGAMSRGWVLFELYMARRKLEDAFFMDSFWKCDARGVWWDRDPSEMNARIVDDIFVSIGLRAVSRGVCFPLQIFESGEIKSYHSSNLMYTEDSALNCSFSVTSDKTALCEYFGITWERLSQTAPRFGTTGQESFSAIKDLQFRNTLEQCLSPFRMQAGQSKKKKKWFSFGK